jgi:hypothetical protein
MSPARAEVRRSEVAESSVMPEWRKLAELAAVVAYRGDYNATVTDPHFGATSPLAPKSCRCERPWLVSEDGEAHCSKCGKRIQEEDYR